MKTKPLLGSVAAMSLITSPVAGMPGQPGRAPRTQDAPVTPGRKTNCDDTLKAAFRPDRNTRVTLVKAFRAGEKLVLDGRATGPVAANDVCMVKLNVGPGNPGPSGAPSTSVGIGIEIWLPAREAWTGRTRLFGGGGFAGSAANPLASLDTRAGATAASDGWVTATTDTGHIGNPMDGSFAMNPDGTVNTRLWEDFSSRAVHEMAVRTKELAALYYGRPVLFAYWDGCSTGGRQGLKEAQAHPEDFDGILAVAPAINWTRFITAELYPQIVMQRDLGGVPLLPAQIDLVSAAAVSACDTKLNGQHDGFISDHNACRYDPSRDRQVLCRSDGGLNDTSACVSKTQARAMIKMWYGQTADGHAPAPDRSNGYGPQLRKDQLWYGVTRGTFLASPMALAASRNGVPTAFPISTNQIALQMQDPSVAGTNFRNARSDGAERWKALGYAHLADAQRMGIELQPRFDHINTDNPDLGAFQAKGGKLLHLHGLADQLIPSQGSMNYYTRVAEKMGGFRAIGGFYRYYEIPAMGHCGGVGAVNGLRDISPPANPPLPARDQMFNLLVDWVEKGQAPGKIVLESGDRKLSRPICPYPAMPVYAGGDRSVAASYRCEGNRRG